ncbi:MAG: aminotransferase class IV [Kiritimatiellaeota bacterium]|nr:aminotransferase class IV [Kiritimatiellota bacterium]
MKIISFSDYTDALAATRMPWMERYYAMYSSVLGGVVTDPVLMQAPLDDHLVHRGDGVFDTFKCVGRAAYNLDAHLGRLMRSAEAIALAWPGGVGDIREIVLQTLAVAGRDDCLCRVILARGPGGFGVSPYESPRPALYVVVYAAGTLFMTAHPGGGRAMRSGVPVKSGNWATFKHCNYLPNAQVKREAVDGGCDFAFTYDPLGFLAEGATENAGIVTPLRELLFPKPNHILSGTTMLRVMRLAEALLTDGTLARIAFADISESDVRGASEMLVVGTTLDVASACVYDGAPVGDGRPGPVGTRLNALLAQDIAENSALRTPY